MVWSGGSSTSALLDRAAQDSFEPQPPEQVKANRRDDTPNVRVQSGNIQSKRHLESAARLYFEPRRPSPANRV